MDNGTISVHQDLGEIGQSAQVTGVELNVYPHFAAAPRSLRRSFDALMSDKIKGFVGRQFVFDAADDFINMHGLSIGFPAKYMYNREYGALYMSHGSAAPSWAEFLKMFCGCYVPSFELYTGAQNLSDEDMTGDGEYYNQFLFEPEANLTTGSVGISLEVATGSSCPSAK